MRKLFNVLGLVSAITAVIMAALPYSNYTIYPAIAAIIFGAVSFYKSKQKSKKVVQLIFLLTILSLGLATYKGVFSNDEEETINNEADKLEKNVRL